MKYYDPEESLKIEQQFQGLCDQLPQFGEFLKNFVNDAGISDLLIERLRSGLEKLKCEYEDYINTFDPKEKLLLHEAWRTKATQFLAIIERLVKGVKRINDERQNRA